MVPYIAVLLIIIAAALFTVKRQVDAFSQGRKNEKAPSLYEAICSAKESDEENDTKKEKEPIKEVTPAETSTESPATEGDAPSVSSEFTKEMENRISKSVATQLKDTLLSQRATQNMMADTSCPYAPVSSDATAQGSEYVQAKPHPGPDMSEYIRKDSIPCWNCSLPN